MTELPVPVFDDLWGPFWKELVDGRLTMPLCPNGHRFFVPEPVCPTCLSATWSWSPVGGRGSLYSWSVVHRAPVAGVATPYVIAVVDLDEGWTLMTHLVDVAPGRPLLAGDRVALRITHRGGWALPTFALEEDQ
jgi:uncharacterized OB-fold protein